jgi:DNA-directed RNA polymerase subunit RPC12/RpoP
MKMKMKVNLKKKYKTLKCSSCKNKIHWKKSSLENKKEVACWKCGNKISS